MHNHNNIIMLSDFNCIDGFTSRYLTLRPGENATVKLILQNTGEASTFKMTVKAATTGNSTESFFEYAIFPENVTLETSGESELAVDIYLSNDTIDGLVVTFTATAASIEDESINNFITFNMVTTTLPHPVITENVMLCVKSKAHVINQRRSIHQTYCIQQLNFS